MKLVLLFAVVVVVPRTKLSGFLTHNSSVQVRVSTTLLWSCRPPDVSRLLDPVDTALNYAVVASAAGGAGGGGWLMSLSVSAWRYADPGAP